MKIGFIGLGNMGQGMADNLIKNGADLTVFTRTKSKIDAMVKKGVKGAESTADLTKQVDLVLVCLPDVATSRDVLMGDNGVFTHSNPGQVIVDHSTVDIQTSRDCYDAASRKDCFFLDAPISGGPVGASEGTLAIMAGGDESAFEQALPYFNMMGANIKHMGPPAAGTVMKLINQLLVGIHTVGAAEAFALANATGVNIEEAADLLAVSWGGSTMVTRNAPITARRDFPNSAAPVRNGHKDLKIIVDYAKSAGLKLDLLTTSSELFSEMMEQGNQEHDIAGVIEVIEQHSKK